MTSWLRYALIGGGSAIAVAAAAYFALPLLRTHPVATASASSGFTKSAIRLDSSGNPVLDSSGNPVPFTGPVHPGDQIEYVLTYTPPATGSSGPVTITDTLSPNQTYIDPSIVAPGWTFPTPGYAGNTETYSSPGVSAGGSATLTVPAISGTAGAPGGGGDGFEPIPVVTSVGTKVLAVNHHQAADGNIMCWMGATLAVCPGYPKRASTLPEQIPTATWTHGAVLNKKIYFPAGRYDNATKATLEFGIGCWDAQADTNCPFISLPGTPTVTLTGNWNTYFSASGTFLGGYLVGVRADPGNPSHMMIYAQDKVYCVDVAIPSNPACTGWTTPATVSPNGNGRYRDMIAEENGTRMFVSNSTGHVFCLNNADGSTCAGWPATGVSGSTPSSWSLGPGIDNVGTMNAVCLNVTLPSGFECFNIATSAPMPGAWPSYMSSRSIFAAYHIPTTARILYPEFGNASVPNCHDFGTGVPGTGLPCTPFAPYWTSDNSGSGVKNVSDYGYASDPAAPKDCIYGHGDGGILVRFAADGSAATKACLPKTYTTTYDLKDQFCAHQPGNATWTTLDITGRPAALVGGTITIKDSTGTVLQTITVTAANTYAVNLPATGANSKVTIEFTPNYGSSDPPATDYQLKLNYTSDTDPQICYKVVIKDCSDTLSQGPVTNTAVYTDSLGSKTAKVDLGKVTGGHCGPPPCLKLQSSITLNPDGTGTLTLTGSGPPGFNSVIVNVHANTPGVSVAPPSRTFPPGPINGTWILSGITPGESIDLQIDAIDPGAGTNGSDKCCSSTITVIVPGHHDHQQDVGILKTGVSEGQGPANGSGYTYTLSVTNYATPLNGQNAITVTDVVPAGLSFASAGGTDWTCTGPFPIAAGGTLSCLYTGTGLLATGQVLPPITVVSTNAVPNTQLGQVTNCADVGIVFGMGIMDTVPSNNRSCITLGQQASNGSLTVTKVVETQGGIDTSTITFQAQVSCVSGTSAAVTTTLNLNQADGYTQTIPNVPVGAVCSVTEPAPAVPTSFPPRCHWETSYPDGQQATIPAGNKALRIVNHETCPTQPTQGTNVTVIKTPVIDGKPTHTPGVAFPIQASCVQPDGVSVNLGFTASTAAGFRGLPHLVPLGTRCTVHEPAPPVPPSQSRCHWVTSYLLNGTAVPAFPVAITTVIAPTNVLEVRNVLECAIPPVTPHCDPKSAKAVDGACVCLYPGMKPDRRDPTHCTCPQGSLLQPGRGCVSTEDLCPTPDGHWNGKVCVTCPDRSQWDDRTKKCVAPPLECHDPMIPNPAGTACVCPDGSAGRHGKCDTHGTFDNPFGHNGRDRTHSGNGDDSDDPTPGGHTPRSGKNAPCIPGVPC